MKLSLLFVATFASMALAMPVAQPEDASLAIAARQEGDYPIGGGKPCDRKRDPQRKGFTTPTCLKIREEADIAFIAITKRQEGDYPIGGGKPCDRKRDPQRKGFTTPTCLKMKRDEDALAAYEVAFGEVYVK